MKNILCSDVWIRKNTRAMPTPADPFPALAAKRAVSRELAAFFQQLAVRAEMYAQMQDEFLTNVVARREARTGKPYVPSKALQKSLERDERDAEVARGQIKEITRKMDDKTLLASALSSEDHGVQLDEFMLRGCTGPDRVEKQRLIDFRKETIQLIETFVENSEFKGQVRSIWRKK